MTCAGGATSFWIMRWVMPKGGIAEIGPIGLWGLVALALGRKEEALQLLKLCVPTKEPWSFIADQEPFCPRVFVRPLGRPRPHVATVAQSPTGSAGSSAATLGSRSCVFPAVTLIKQLPLEGGPSLFHPSAGAFHSSIVVKSRIRWAPQASTRTESGVHAASAVPGWYAESGSDQDRLRQREIQTRDRGNLVKDTASRLRPGDWNKLSISPD